MLDHSTRPSASTDAALAVLWCGIIGAARHIAKRQPLASTQRPMVVQLKPGSAKMPVYFIGGGLREIRVAPLISSHHPVFAVEIPWPSQWHDAAVKGDVEALPTLKEMVAPYAAALHAHSGSTPCVIVGYSFQGLMGFEAAHRIQELGGKVEMVMLLDAPAQYPATHCIAWRKFQETWKLARKCSAGELSAHCLASRLASSLSILRWTIHETGSVVKERLLLALGYPGQLTTRLDTLGRPLAWRLIRRLYTNAVRTYDLRPLDCRGAVFRADRSGDCPGGGVEYSLGWNGLFARGLQIIQVAGGHDTMWQSPNDVNLAHEMGNALNGL
jgi:thioesterase domain-containing protein